MSGALMAGHFGRGPALEDELVIRVEPSEQGRYALGDSDPPRT